MSAAAVGLVSNGLNAMAIWKGVERSEAVGKLWNLRHLGF